MQISGNTILITGGTSGIGLAFAEEFIKNGNKVIITGRRTERLQAIADRIPGIITKNSDIADATQRAALADWVITHHPDTNVLINNAGVQLAIDLKKPLDMQRVYSEIDTNLVGPLHLASLFAAHLGTKENAVIINVTSGLAFVPLAFMPVYCATKAAMHSATISMRHQLKGIKVFEVAPPAVDTELGHDRRTDKTQSHGGIPVAEFIRETMAALIDDKLEAPIGHAAVLREKGDKAFTTLNSGF